MRPARLANDQTGTAEVVRHAISSHADKGRMPELVCCIYATAAFVTGADLRRGRDLLLEQGADFAFSVCRYGPPVQRALRVDSDGRIEMLRPEYAGARSQDLEPAFHDAGQFYWGTATAWMSGASLFSKASAAVVLPRDRVLDIDTPEDWSLAEALFRIHQERSSSMSKSVLVVAAHPDDEALGCGGTIAKLATAGATVRVAFIADGSLRAAGHCGHGSAQACGASGSSRESLRAPRRQRGLFRGLPRQPPRYRAVIVPGAVRRSADCKASAGDAPDPPRRRSQRRSSTRASSRRDGLPAATRLARSERCSRLRCPRARSGSLQVPARPSLPTGSWTYPARWTRSSRLWMPMQSRCATGRTHVRAKPSSTWRGGAGATVGVAAAEAFVLGRQIS